MRSVYHSATSAYHEEHKHNQDGGSPKSSHSPSCCSAPDALAKSRTNTIAPSSVASLSRDLLIRFRHLLGTELNMIHGSVESSILYIFLLTGWCKIVDIDSPLVNGVF